MTTNAKRFYILSMLIITAKKRYGNVKAAGVIRVIKEIANKSKNELR